VVDIGSEDGIKDAIEIAGIDPLDRDWAAH
jgi:hypothetical protein